MEMDQQQKTEMLGSHPDRVRPMTVFGWPVKDAAIVFGIIFAIGAGYFQLEWLKERLDVLPSDVQRSVKDLSAQLTTQLGKLEATIETTRTERNAEIKGLELRISKGEAERAAQGQKLDNLEDLMRDIRSLMREEYGGRGDNGAGGKG